MKIGIIGGGQLAMMMCESSPEHEYFVLEKSKNCSCKNVATIIEGNYDDPVKLKELSKSVDVITYEFENVPYESIEHIKDKTYPNYEILKISQNRLLEKQMAVELRLKTPKFFLINSVDELKDSLKKINGSGILKTTTGGYDGKGQSVIKNYKIPVEAKDMIDSTKCILEEFIDIKYETSIIGFRDIKGNFATLPINFNKHKEGILYSTESGIKTRHKPTMVSAVRSIMEKYDVVGTLAIEFFITNDDKYAFNEMAPRPHNSGHWSIEGASTSQFRNHILCVSGEELEVPQRVKPAIMINLLGDEIIKIKNSSLPANCYFHNYLKDEVRDKRKMGHITIMSDTYDELIESKDKIERIIGEKTWVI